MRQPGLLLACVLFAVAGQAQEQHTFGAIRSTDGTTTPITWQPAPNVADLAGGILSFIGKGTVKSDLLPLKTLHLYDIAAETKRRPGARNRFTIVFENDRGLRGQRAPVWQYPGESRPNWYPIAPYRCDYVQGLILPPDTRRVWLELAVDGSEIQQFAANPGWDLFKLEFIERQAVTFKQTGPNALPEGNLETANGKIPAGWTVWIGGTDRIEIMEAGEKDPAPVGEHFLRVHAGPWMYFAENGHVPVKRGSAWEISLWLRGKGSVGLSGIVLDNSSPIPLRVGDPQNQGVTVDTNVWKKYSFPWFAESPQVKSAQILLTILATENLDVDDVEFRPYENQP